MAPIISIRENPAIVFSINQFWHHQRFLVTLIRWRWFIHTFKCSYYPFWFLLKRSRCIIQLRAKANFVCTPRNKHTRNTDLRATKIRVRIKPVFKIFRSILNYIWHCCKCPYKFLCPTVCWVLEMSATFFEVSKVRVQHFSILTHISMKSVAVLIRIIF